MLTYFFVEVNLSLGLAVPKGFMAPDRNQARHGPLDSKKIVIITSAINASSSGVKFEERKTGNRRATRLLRRHQWRHT